MAMGADVRHETGAPDSADRHSESRWPTRTQWTVVAALAAVTLVMLRPTPHALSRTLTDPGDPALHVWTLRWGWHALAHHPLHVFDAPIFWPHRTSLAYSDTLLPLAPLWTLLATVTGSWLIALNLLVLGLIGANVAATYALAYRLVARRDAAVVAAVVFGFSSYVFSHLGHLQLLTVGLVPWAMVLVLRLLEAPRLRTAVTLGVVTALTLYVAAYYMPVVVIALATVVGGHLSLRRFRVERAVWRHLVVAGVVAAVIAIPMARTYVSLQHDPTFRRGAQPGAGLHPSDLIAPAQFSYVYAHRLVTTTDVEHSFFVGFLALALALIGFVTVIRGARRARASTRVRETQLIVLAGLVLSVFALGDEAYGHHLPFWLLRAHAPGFDGIRQPARFAVFGLLVLALLAAHGYAVVRDRIPRVPSALVAAGTVGVVMVELAAPVRHLPFDLRSSTLASYRALAHKPAGAVVELPMFDARFAAGAFVEAPRMVYATIDWHPRVNGYSGFLPSDYIDQTTVLNTFPDPVSLQLMNNLHVRYVLLHEGARNRVPEMARADVRRILQTLPANAHVTRYHNDWLIDLAP